MVWNFATHRESANMRWEIEFKDNWAWVVALDAYDFCDPQPLAALIEKKVIPDELRNQVSKIITGERKPNKRAAAKLSVPASERLVLAAHVSICLGLIDALKNASAASHWDGGDWVDEDDTILSMQASRYGKEPIELKRELEKEQSELMRQSAQDHGISIETLENLLRELRKKQQNYPDV
ncbi:hypothetical protein [Yoonia sp.]|uniref:hypothetical protein n=1 Tax=Yoonia sp. TaxID=2212373 RepID=UPI0019E3310A|nr:hypothetical protein [Yoonia sp.]MBE0414838.1 hypothetical protein [Yoonia sp.]